MDLTPEQIAHVVHEANRALQRVLGDQWVSPPWWEAPRSQRDGLINGVRLALEGADAEALHEEWVRWRRKRGWKYGPVKDEYGKTHPCLVPYAELPLEQRVKDELLRGIVLILSRQLEAAGRG